MDEPQSIGTPRSRLLDLGLLIGLALLICVGGVGSFLLADKYHVDPKWIAVALNSLVLIPIVARRFRRGMASHILIPFVLIWMLCHGFLATYLTMRVRLTFWLPVFMAELALGFWVSVRLSERSKQGDASLARGSFPAEKS